MKLNPSILVAVGLTALTSLFTACQTGSGSLESIATPARIEAVVALGAYAGARAELAQHPASRAVFEDVAAPRFARDLPDPAAALTAQARATRPVR